MKIKQEDFEVLEKVINKTINCIMHPQAYTVYMNAGLTEKRYRWDLLWASGIKIGDSIGNPGDLNLYDYMHDNHIDTALKTITATN